MLAYTTSDVTNPMMIAYGDKTELTIPDVPEGKYIIMKWQSHDAEAGEVYSITSNNLCDLNGTKIEQDIKIAKVVEIDTRARGTLVFRVTEAGDVVFKQNDNGWSELYEITVADSYTSDMQLCNSAGHTIRAINSAFVYDGKSSKTVTYKAGPNFAACVRGGNLTFGIETEGTVQASLQTTPGENNSWYDLKLTVTGGVGNVKIIQNVLDNTGTYVLNKLETWIPVGILETLQYPYTWDFTTENMSKSLQKVSESTVDADQYGSWNASKGEANTFYIPTNASDAADKKCLTSDKYLFASGSQLTLGTETINETRGLGIGWTTELNANDAQNKATLTDKGLILSRRGGCIVVVTIPSVSTGSMVYVKTENNVKPNLVRSLPSKTEFTELEDSYSEDGAYGYKITTGGNIEIRFDGGPTIEKIGVTNITKSLNNIGYATESRNHAIDHRLTGEFTKNDANAYVVTYGSYNKDKATVSKSEVSVVPDNTGIVLYKKDATESVTVPLFYPAINIKPLNDESSLFASNMMAPNVVAITDGSFKDETETINGVSYTRFIMTRTYYTYKDGEFSDAKTAEQEGFYRMIGSKSGNMGANKSYLLVPTDNLPVAAWNGGDGNAKSGYIMFEEDIASLDETTTAIVNIDDMESVAEGEQKTYYTLSGVKLSGKPAVSGIYICNGKKVVIK